MALFPGNYFTISFTDLIGYVITIISVVLVIKQLNQARLATQMSGFLALSDQFGDIATAIEFVDSLSISQQWNDFDGRGAFNFLTEDHTHRESYKQVAAFYEILAALIRRGALDRKIAVDSFGALAVSRYYTLQKAIIYHRELLNEVTLYDQWEWLSIEFARK